MSWNFIKLFWLTEEQPSAWSVAMWRLGVSAFVTLTALFIVYAFGGLFGLAGFARASDVDSKIEDAVEPITERLSTIEDEQGVQGGYLRRLVKSDLERLINREILARCNATTSAEKQRIKSAIDAYQAEYENVFGVRYDEPTCEML